MDRPSPADIRWLDVAIAIGERACGTSRPNPNVGCVLVRGDHVVGRGWTQTGGRPHAEAMAIDQARGAACGATAYVSLEPCAHASARGPACADVLIAAGVTRVVAAAVDPDPRTHGQGFERLAAAGIDVAIADADTGRKARRAMAGWWSRQTRGRPFVTVKMATSLDGMIAMASGASQWITGDRARAHAHLERARHAAILVGRGTFTADTPTLDVRLAGMADRSPRRLLLTSGPAPDGWETVASPAAIDAMTTIDSVLVEGGALTAASFIADQRADQLLVYRAPILVGCGRTALADIGLADLASAHGRWRLVDSRMLGCDRFERYISVSQD